MKLKQLECLLGHLQQFSNPKVELEQYPTGPHIASRLLYTAENSFDDISNKVVADFGCGCGTLGAAAALLGAEQVIGIDIDSQSLGIASMNAENLELDIDFVQCDISNLGWRGQIVDTVVMNPPFGTRKKGADIDFLFVALKVASEAVYSLHKTSTRDLRFDVPQLYKFHKKKEVDIAVDLWRFVPKRSRGENINVGVRCPLD
ncbi:methyltransferase-like protein 5 isoform X5 [Durio zibethinus]|uniref:Methyltransferase-like protein 5 n=1 Tax=Durio zibethinus TaxID=66656 RepID=A0A6P5ZRE6_DURZI|nr:methyltransferase-like protein 5 isoform X5 [Durio zibethinus]